jgi:hypothetical protein
LFSAPIYLRYFLDNLIRIAIFVKNNMVALWMNQKKDQPMT